MIRTKGSSGYIWDLLSESEIDGILQYQAFENQIDRRNNIEEVLNDNSIFVDVSHMEFVHFMQKGYGSIIFLQRNQTFVEVHNPSLGMFPQCLIAYGTHVTNERNDIQSVHRIRSDFLEHFKSNKLCFE